MLELLSIGPWVKQGSTDVGFTTSDTTYSPTSPYRFVRVQCTDASGSLRVSLGSATDAAAATDAGSVRVFPGTYQIFRCAPGGNPTIKVSAVTGTVTGSVAWAM